MSGAITAVAAASVLGAGASAYSAKQQADAAKASVSSYNEMIQSSLNDDEEIKQWMKEMYLYGDVNPWVTEDGSPAATTPYESAERPGEKGYYLQNGRVVDEEWYNKRSRNGTKSLEKYKGWEWVPAKNTADPSTSQQQIEKRNLEYTSKLQPKTFEYANQSIDSATRLLPKQEAATAAELQYTIDTKPEQALADIAGYKYTQETMPEKTLADIAGYKYIQETMPEKALADIAGYKYAQEAMPLKTDLAKTIGALAKRDTESEAARAAGAEMAQAYNTKQKMLGDTIRRTGALAGSGRMAGLQEDLDLSRVKDTAGARIAARRNARNNQIANIAGALGAI